MPSHGQVAARVRADKEAHPENYCPAKNCLWRSYGLHCPNHTLRGDESAQAVADHFAIRIGETAEQQVRREKRENT